MILVYTTVPTAAAARKISRALLTKKLAGCVVMFPVGYSAWWKGKLGAGHEHVVLAKSREHLASAVEKEIEKHHPYEVPCILQIPVSRANAAYLRWLDDVTSKSTRTR